MIGRPEKFNDFCRFDGPQGRKNLKWTAAKAHILLNGQVLKMALLGCLDSPNKIFKMPLTYKMLPRVVQGSHCNPLCQHCAQVHNNSLPPPPQQFPAHCLCGCCASQLTSTHDTCPFAAPRPRNPSRICSSRYSSTVAPVPREDFPMALNGRPRKLY